MRAFVAYLTAATQRAFRVMRVCGDVDVPPDQAESGSVPAARGSDVSTDPPGDNKATDGPKVAALLRFSTESCGVVAWF